MVNTNQAPPLCWFLFIVHIIKTLNKRLIQSSGEMNDWSWRAGLVSKATDKGCFNPSHILHRVLKIRPQMFRINQRDSAITLALAERRRLALTRFSLGYTANDIRGQTVQVFQEIHTIKSLGTPQEHAVWCYCSLELSDNCYRAPANKCFVLNPQINQRFLRFGSGSLTTLIS